MHYLVGLVCIFFVIFFIIVDKRLYNPIVLFNFWWGITILISGFGLFGINIPSDTTYLIILTSIISFNISSVSLYFVSKGKIINIEHKIKNYNYKQAVNFVISLNLIIMFILINRSIKVLKLLWSGLDYSKIRYIFFYDNSILSGYDRFIDSWFILPIITFSIIVTTISFFRNYYNKFLFIIIAITVGLYSFSSGSREIILLIGISFLLSFLIEQKKIKLNLTKKFQIQIVLILVFVAIVLLTKSRSGNENNLINYFIKTIVLYFTAPYIYFEKLYPYALNDNVLLFGGAFFGGIIDIFIYMLRFIEINIKPIVSYISKYNQMYLPVGENVNYNAFPTMIYTFLYDYNFFGILLGPSFFGIISMISFIKMEAKKTLPYIGVYIMFGIMIYESILKWTGTSSKPWLVIILFLIMEKISKKKFKINL